MHGHGRPFAYEADQIGTASKSKLVLMLYDGIIRFVTEAKTKIDAGDVPGRGLFIGKAQKIVCELNSCLNHEKGGSVARSLNKVYVESNRLLTNANISGKPDELDIVLSMFTDIREAWVEITSGSAPAEDPMQAAVNQEPTQRLAFRA